MKDIIEFPVVGSKYLGPIEEDVFEGSVLKLEAEPSNTFDSSAIKVTTANNIHLGYVPNRGTCCSLCWTAVPGEQTLCPSCSADWTHFVKGGLATRFINTKLLSSPFSCYVKKIDLSNSFAPITAKLVILD